MKILVADDDPVSRRVMGMILQKCGYEVVTAENGARALETLAGDEAPRLALLDWMMPELDGFDVCRQVRARLGVPYTYIILLTSKLSEGDVVAGLDAGSDDYLTKPCNPAELRARLRTGQRILSLEDTLVEAREEMRFKATHDALTGLWNHGSILSLLSEGLNRSPGEPKSGVGSALRYRPFQTSQRYLWPFGRRRIAGGIGWGRVAWYL